MNASVFRDAHATLLVTINYEMHEQLILVVVVVVVVVVFVYGISQYNFSVPLLNYIPH